MWAYTVWIFHDSVSTVTINSWFSSKLGVTRIWTSSPLKDFKVMNRYSFCFWIQTLFNSHKLTPHQSSHSCLSKCRMETGMSGCRLCLALCSHSTQARWRNRPRRVTDCALNSAIIVIRQIPGILFNRLFVSFYHMYHYCICWDYSYQSRSSGEVRSGSAFRGRGKRLEYLAGWQIRGTGWTWRKSSFFFRILMLFWQSYAVEFLDSKATGQKSLLHQLSKPASTTETLFGWNFLFCIFSPPLGSGSGNGLLCSVLKSNLIALNSLQFIRLRTDESDVSRGRCEHSARDIGDIVQGMGKWTAWIWTLELENMLGNIWYILLQQTCAGWNHWILLNVDR